MILGNSSKNYIPSYANNNVMRVAWSAEIKNLASILSERKIRVNAISPGIILTPYHQERLQSLALKNNCTYEEQLTKETIGIPLNSFGKTEDVANLISFLLSSKAKHINGSNILLDGGESSAY